MEKIIGVVILYHPQEPALTRNINSYLEFVDKIIIVDNSEPSAGLDYSVFGEKALVIADGVNKGIAYRLNQAAAIALLENAGWLLTMDQDSYFDPESLCNYLQCLQQLAKKDTIAMVGVEHVNKPVKLDCVAVKALELITSGSLVNLKVFKEIGGFDENLFIDEVDTDYCFAAVTKGFEVVKLPHIFLEHTLGEPGCHRSLKTWKNTSRILHPPVRMYYMARNYFYLKRKFGPQLPEAVKKRRAAILNMVKNNLLYGGQRMQLARYLYLAYRDFRNGRMGKINLK